jgi:SpoVK/Ycf46/Vps4 family AAA+-type ATPase
MVKSKKPEEPESKLPIEVVEQNEQIYQPHPANIDYPRLDDICGSDKLKQSLEDIVFNIKHAELYSMMCTAPDKSYMLAGPPATGKTLSMKAIRNELIQEGMQVMEAAYDIGTYGTAYINMGAVNLQKFFDNVEKVAQQGYVCMVMFDECDSLLSKRGNRMSSHKEDDKLLNCMMKNQQRIHDNTLPIYMFFATNFPESLDEASIRSGRIDKVIRYELPDKQGLFQGYKNKVARKNDEFNELYPNINKDMFRRVNYNKLAVASQGFNYADIDNVIEKALKYKVKDIINAPQDKIIDMGYISQKQLMYQITQLQQTKQDVRYRKIGF